MGVLDAMKRIVGGAPQRVQLDGQPSEGTALDAVRSLIGAVGEAVPAQRRDCSTDAYLEAVLESARVERCEELLAGALGPPAKPFGERAAFGPGVETMIDSRGGIDRGQCLYLRRFADGRVAFAALWPWSNGRSCTLKLGVYDEDVTPPPTPDAA